METKVITCIQTKWKTNNIRIRNGLIAKYVNQYQAFAVVCMHQMLCSVSVSLLRLSF